MSKTLTISLLWVLLCCLTACKKDTVSNQTKEKTSSQRNQLFGAWELRRVYGGLTNANFAPGSGNLLIFNDKAFVEYSSMSIAKQGLYDIIRDNSGSETVCKSLPDGQFADRIVYDKDFLSQKIFFQINHDTLTLVSGCFTMDEGGFIDYIRRQ